MIPLVNWHLRGSFTQEDPKPRTATVPNPDALEGVRPQDSLLHREEMRGRDGDTEFFPPQGVWL